MADSIQQPKEQKLVIVLSTSGEYHNYFKYPFKIQRELDDGWLVHSITVHTSTDESYATIIYERYI
jgi:hypothetical protein